MGHTKICLVRFRSDPSRNRNRVRARGHKDYCFYGMITDTVMFLILPWSPQVLRQIATLSREYIHLHIDSFAKKSYKRGSWWGVPNPSSQLIFSPNPSSQLLEFLQSQPIIRHFLQIPKSQLFLGKQSQFPAIYEGQSQVPVNGHQDPHKIMQWASLH